MKKVVFLFVLTTAFNTVFNPKEIAHLKLAGQSANVSRK
jgi:hypothetical protein